MSRLIILFVILTIWAIVNIVKARRKFESVQTGKKPEDGRNGRKNVPGKKYSWTWMQAAGALHLKFIRPEQANGYPAINGTINGITVMVQCSPQARSQQESMTFRFLFPEPAGIGLELTTAENPADLPKKDGPDQTGLLLDRLKQKPAGTCFMRVDKPDIFRNFTDEKIFEQISRLSRIYPKVFWSDSELLVRTAGINNDPERFREQLEALLTVAGSLADFARLVSERQKITVRIPPELAEKEKNTVPNQIQPRKEPEKEPEPVVRPPEPVRPSESKPVTPPPEDLLQDRSAFLHLLWRSGLMASRQKELFAPYAGREVEWEGILKTCFPFSTDFVFGKEGGIKATFELEEFKPEGSFMPIRIKAVAAFPKTEQSKLEKAFGIKFRFRGKLLKIEPIAREIYLSCGIITGAES